MFNMEFRKGDKIKIGDLETTVLGFTQLHKTWLICTEYGDFNITLVKKDEE